MSTVVSLANLASGSSVTKTTITDGDTYSWRIDDALDSGILMYTDNSLTPIEPFTLATINMGNSAEKMWVAEDSVVMLSKINNQKVYQHTLKLVELTKVLEKILITGICMTPTDKASGTPMYSTLDSQLAIAIDKINLQSNYIVLKTASTYDTTRLMRKKSPETFVFNNSTAREILDEIFSTIDSRVVVTNAYRDSSNIYPTGTVILEIDYIRMVAGNDVALGSDLHHKLISESSSNSVESYAGEIYSNVESAVSDNEITIQDTFKANDALATSSNRIMSLPYAIQYPTSFQLKAATSLSMTIKFSVTTWGGTTQWAMQFDLTNKWFDALDYFVDYEYWVTLGTTTQNKTLYYKRGETETDVSRTYKSLIVTKSVIANLFHALIVQEFTNNFDYYKEQIENSQYGQDGATISHLFIDSYTTPTIDDIVYEIKYIGEIEGLAVSTKAEDREKFERDLKIVDGQRANVLDITRYGRNLEGKIARVGNNLTYIDCDVDAYENILPLLTRLTDYDNGIIYQADISRHIDSETWYEVRYYLSKNYNDLNERIALKKEKRIYAIPTKGYQVILPDRETVYIDYGNSSSHYSIITSMSGTPALIAKALGGDAKQITNAFITVQTDTDTVLPDPLLEKKFVLPVVCYGAGNTMNMVAKFYDNASAGLSIDTSSYGGINWLGGKKVSYNKYTNDYGYAHTMRVGWGYYPNARTTAGVQAQPLLLTGGSAETITESMADTFYQEKDPSEAIGFQKIIKVLPGSSYVVIGAFCDINCLMRDIGNVYLYYQPLSRETYKPGDVKVRYDSSTDTKISLAGLMTYALDLTYSDKITASAYSLNNIHKYNMAFGDNDGNLFVAINGETYGDQLFTVYKKEARG